MSSLCEFVIYKFLIEVIWQGIWFEVTPSGQSYPKERGNFGHPHFQSLRLHILCYDIEFIMFENRNYSLYNDNIHYSTYNICAIQPNSKVQKRPKLPRLTVHIFASEANILITIK